MTFPEEQIAELTALFPEVQQAEEGGVTFFMIPAHSLPDGCTPGTVDLLLCPSYRDGYPHRVFYSAPVQGGNALTWSTFYILGRPWYAVSWRTRDGLRLAQILAAHLDAVRPRRAA
ncbi:MAG TPA: hypothetical protein VF710_02615 [Longimicrobium sp.]|jgi:hypothetical protein